MWTPVKKENEELGLTATTIGELKEILSYIPDNYLLSGTGTTFGIVMDEEEEIVLMDDVVYLENLLIEQDYMQKTYN